MRWMWINGLLEMLSTIPCSKHGVWDYYERENSTCCNEASEKQ